MDVWYWETLHGGWLSATEAARGDRSSPLALPVSTLCLVLDVRLSFKFHGAKRVLVTAVFSLELWQRCVAYTREVVFAAQDGVLVKSGKKHNWCPLLMDSCRRMIREQRQNVNTETEL